MQTSGIFPLSIRDSHFPRFGFSRYSRIIIEIVKKYLADTIYFS